MRETMALTAAIELLHAPSRVRFVRSGPLPDGILLLLRIAAGDEEAEAEAVRVTSKPRDTVRRAATFFIEQILLSPGADSYRVLGANTKAASADLRRNMALLLRWLHPDHDARGERSMFAGRVTSAWNNLKTMERREAYDRAFLALEARKNRAQKHRNANQSPVKFTDARRPMRVGRRSGGHGNVELGVQSGSPPGLLRRAFLFLFFRARV